MALKFHWLLPEKGKFFVNDTLILILTRTVTVTVTVLYAAGYCIKFINSCFEFVSAERQAWQCYDLQYYAQQGFDHQC